MTNPNKTEDEEIADARLVASETASDVVKKCARAGFTQAQIKAIYSVVALSRRQSEAAIVRTLAGVTNK